jgi:hypothetical protein
VSASIALNEQHSSDLDFERYWKAFKEKRKLPDGSYLLMADDVKICKLAYRAGWEAHKEERRQEEMSRD